VPLRLFASYVGASDSRCSSQMVVHQPRWCQGLTLLFSVWAHAPIPANRPGAWRCSGTPRFLRTYQTRVHVPGDLFVRWSTQGDSRGECARGNARAF